MTRPRAADDFPMIRSRMMELRRGRDQLLADHKRRSPVGSIEALNREVVGLRLVIAVQKEELARRVPTEGLGEPALSALNVFRDRLVEGEGIREAALGVAGYRSPDVDAAMANHDRQEMRAFEALLSRPSLRRRLALWLLRDDR